MAWVQTLEFEVPRLPWTLNLHAIADMQIGSESSFKPYLRSKFSEIIKDPQAAVVVLGDIEDDDRPSTRAMRKTAFAARPEVLAKMARDHRSYLDKEVIPILEPLTKVKHGILGVLRGHHWYDLTPANNDIPLTSTEYICKKLEHIGGRPWPHLGEMSSWLWLKFHLLQKGDRRHAMIKTLIHIQHGSGAGQSIGYPLTQLEKTRLGLAGQAFIRAHDCQLAAAKKPVLEPKDSIDPYIYCKNIAYLNVGSVTQGYVLTKGDPAYPEKKMMRPGAIGWGILKIDVRDAHSWEDKSKNPLVDFRVEI